MPDVIQTILSRYANFAMTGDGLPEINSLSYLAFESEFAEPLPPQRLALVLVEPRLLAPGGDPAAQPALMRALRRFKGDLRAEGLITRFIAADLYGGPVHKDGRIVLALRRFFGEVKAFFPGFEGAVLVGNFPEASLARFCAWAPGSQLVIGPELISERADIVLADLTGGWESLYRQELFTVENLAARPDSTTTARGWFDGESIRNCDFSSSDYTATTATLRDVFYLNDAIFTVLARTPTSLRVLLRQAEQNNEVDSADRNMRNIIARPDIAVSRINARHIAVNPNPALVGTDGRRFLDSSGNPQTVTNPTPLYSEPQYLALFNFRDFDLERRLLINYFDRNHRFRTGAHSNLPFRVAAISGSPDFDPRFYGGMLSAAAGDFAPSVEVPYATLTQYVDFLKTPAVLKYVMAHSTSHDSQFRDSGDVAALTVAVGGRPLRWVFANGQHTPSFEGQGGVADLFVHRALWHHGTLENAGASLVVHGGCGVNSIAETQTQVYTAPRYGHWNNAEGVLFYTNCVALLSRAKGFNDAPGGFADGYRMSDRANFGSCWINYYNTQANDSGLTTYNIQRKRAYFWSLSGDWSLRLRNRNGLGFVGVDTSLKSLAVHPNQTWIDGWKFDAQLNPIAGVGDLDGDGFDEFVVTSEWGIGVLKHDGDCFRVLMQAPRDTWFGGWRWDASSNFGRDRIKAVDDFTGDSKREIMVWSSWGIATLGYAAGTLIPSRLHVNGTRFGGWLLNTADNTYVGQGKFDTDTNQDMVVTSPWGLGVLSLQRGTAVFIAANGTRLGDWLLGTANNRIRLIADLDGDGFDEILVTSPWGLGVLKMVGGSLRAVAIHANGENLGGYVLNEAHTFALSGRISRGAQHQIVVTDNSGIHVLGLSGSRLTRLAFAPNGVPLDGWIVDTSSNQLQAAGDLTGDGRADFIIRSRWGVGIMGMDATARLRVYSGAAYGAMLRDWRLEAGDVIAGAGRLDRNTNRTALLVTKP